MDVEPRVYLNVLSWLTIAVSIIVTILAIVSPTLALHNEAALLTVSTPSGVIGPTVFMGLLGSCARENASVPVTCTKREISPQYDYSVLPENAANLVLNGPPGAFVIFTSIATGLTFIYLLMFSATLRSKKRGLKTVTVFVGCCTWLCLFASFSVLELWFKKTIHDFNTVMNAQGQPSFIASLGNGFKMVWAFYYGLFFLPITVSVRKLFEDKRSEDAPESIRDGSPRLSRDSNPLNRVVGTGSGFLHYIPSVLLHKDSTAGDSVLNRLFATVRDSSSGRPNIGSASSHTTYSVDGPERLRELGLTERSNVCASVHGQIEDSTR